MKLNKDKCEALATGQNEEITFSDNTQIKVRHDVKYLGCMINQKSEHKYRNKQENIRSICNLEKLGELWKHSNCSTRQKLIVYDAVIRTKLIYGMASAQINDAVKNKIDAFQIKGLRQILKMESTYAQK